MNTVTVKGQVTIPKPIRDALNIGPGSQVEFIINTDGQIVVRKADDEIPDLRRFDRLRGSLKSDMTADEIMALLRGEE